MPKKKTTTDATKAKLPLPKGHPQTRARKQPKVAQRVTGANAKGRKNAKWIECPRCEQMVNSYPTHSCYDAKGLLTPTEIRDGFGSEDAYRDTPAPRAIPCGEDTQNTTSTHGVPATLWYISPGTIRRFADFSTISRPEEQVQAMRVPPPDTSAYPWPVKAVNWLDAAPAKFRAWFAGRLTALAGWVQSVE